MVTVDAAGNILDRNRLFVESLVAKGSKELLKGNIFDFIAKSDLERARADFEKAVEEGPFKGRIYMMAGEDGSEFPAEVSVSIVREKSRNLIVATLKGVPEKQAEQNPKPAEDGEKLIVPQSEYKKLFDDAVDAIFLADAETGIIIDCNKAASQLTGWKKSELIGKHQSMLHPPEVKAVGGTPNRSFQRHVMEHDSIMETQIVTKAGEIKEVAIKASILEINGREIIQGTFRDITKYSKRTKKALREGEERYKELANALPEIVYEADLKGKVIFVNEQVFEMTGYTKEEAEKGLNVLQFVVPEQRERALENMKKSFNGNPSLREYTLLRRDGTTFYAFLKTLPIFSDGKVVGLRGVVFDITERKKIQETLDRDEAIFRAAFDKAAIGTAIATLDGRIMQTNEAFCRMLGYSEEELLGKNVAEITHKDDINCTRSALNDLASGKTDVWYCEKRYIKKDGGIIWASISKASVRVTGDKPLYILEQIQDITERKKAERALKESSDREHLLAELIRNASVAVSAGRPDGTIDMVNLAFEELTGYSQEEIKTISWNTILTPPEYKEMEEEKLTGLRLTKQHVRYEKEYIRKDGSRVPIELNVQPYLDNEGNVMYYLAFITDITERKKMELALAESEARFRAGFNQASVGMAMMSADGIYLNANDALCGILGYSREELIGKNIVSTTHPDDVELTKQHIVAAANSHSETQHYEKRFIRKDGQTISGQIDTSAVTDEKGNVLYLLGTLQDVTIRKEAQEALQMQTKILESMNRILLETLSTESEEELCRKCLEALCDITGSQFGSMDEVDESLRVKNMAISKSGWEECRMPREVALRSLDESGASLTKELVTLGRPLIVNDFQNYPRRYGTPEGHPVIKSFLGVPVKINPSLTALMILANKKGGYTERDRQITEILSLSIAEALSRFRIKDALAEQRALQKSEERFRGIAERSFDAIVTTDLDGRITYCSPSIGKILGFTPDEMLGTNIVDPPWHAGKANGLKAFSRLKAEDHEGSITIPKMKKDGTLIFVEGNISPILKSSDVIGYQAVLRDVTAKLKSQRDLEKSEQKYRELFDVSPIALLDVDLPDIMSSFIKEREINLVSLKEFINNFDVIFSFFSALKIKNANRAAMKLFGVEGLDGLIASFSAFFGSINGSSNTMKTVNGKYRDILEGKEVEIQINSPEGKQMTLGVRMSIFELGEEKPHAIVSLNDVTERYQLMKMKDQFVSAITHELRTPLLSVVGYLEYIRSGSVGQVPERIMPHIETVMRNSLRLKNITDDLLDLSRLDAGKFELKIEDMNLKEALEQCVAEADHILSEKPHAIRLRIQSGQEFIQCDKTRFVQIMMNLLSNAIKYSPDGGHIGVNVSVNGGMLKVQVKDEGIGIRSEDLPKVFERFATIQKPIYAKGTGLGLSVTKELVEAHGGKICADSEGEGKGSTFTFTMPVNH